MQENALQRDDGSDNSVLISRTTILVGATVLLLNSAVLIGLAIGRYLEQPFTDLCMAAGLIGVLGYVGLQYNISRKLTLFGAVVIILISTILNINML